MRGYILLSVLIVGMILFISCMGVLLGDVDDFGYAAGMSLNTSVIQDIRNSQRLDSNTSGLSISEVYGYTNSYIFLTEMVAHSAIMQLLMALYLGIIFMIIFILALFIYPWSNA